MLHRRVSDSLPASEDLGGPGSKTKARSNYNHVLFKTAASESDRNTCRISEPGTKLYLAVSFFK